VKNLSPIITIFMAVGLVVLYILHFASGKGSAAGTDQKADSSVVKLTGDISFAYINTDSLMENYEFAIEMKKVIENKQTKMASELEFLQKKYLKKEQDFMEKYKRNGFLTEKSLEAAQLELQNDAQEFEIYKQEKTNELLEYSNDVNNQLIDTLQNFLKIFNSDYKYQIILNNSALSTNVIQAHPDLDITDTVVKSLNLRYKK